MTVRMLILTLAPLLATASPVSMGVRGRTITLERLDAAGATPIIFLPGDGGWRGAAVTIARTISSWGYPVYGFDTRKYLEDFGKLSLPEMTADVRAVASRVAGPSKVILVGWSQGAAMAVAAASGGQAPIRGVVTLGLPRSGVLGWDWKATLAILAHREPDEPAFDVKPLLTATAPTPLWMIYGAEDEYTAPVTAQSLYQGAAQPKRLEQIAGANHRFDGHRDELYRSLKEGLEWVANR